MKIITGGVTAAKGFQAASAAAGIKYRRQNRYGHGIQRECHVWQPVLLQQMS